MKILFTFFILVAPKLSAREVIGVVEGRPIILACEAKAYPKAMVEWMRHGKFSIFTIPS